MVTEPSAMSIALGAVDALPSFVNPIKIKGVLMPNKMLEYCKTILQKISFSKSLFKKEYKKTFKYLNEGESVELKKWLKANVSKVSNEETTIEGLSNKLIGELNTANMKLNETPRIDLITISIPILFWITLLIQSCNSVEKTSFFA